MCLATSGRATSAPQLLLPLAQIAADRPCKLQPYLQICTAFHIAPELCQGKREPNGGRADIFAAGIVLATLICGMHPMYFCSEDVLQGEQPQTDPQSQVSILRAAG